MADPLNVADYERLAAAALDEGALGYFAGGACDERVLAENEAAWRALRLRPRVLVDVGEVSTATTVLGAEVALPVLVAPTAFHRVLHEEGEIATARGAAAAGTVMCLSTLATTTPAELAAAVPEGPKWFQLYVFRDLRTGFRIPYAIPSLGAERLTPLEALGAIDPTLSWRDLQELASSSPLPVVVKGVQTAEDAELACAHGAAAVVCSNHGGRQLDAVAPTAELLPEVVEAVAGRLEVYVDGGIRRGTDVVAALALGARAVLIGRPALWGLAHAGAAGVQAVLELLRDEVELALALCGCASPAAVTATHVAAVRSPA